MIPANRVEVEREVRRLCERGAVSDATVAAIRGYGPEILGFLIAQHQSYGDADEIFSLWSERLLQGLPGFGWDSTLRTWAYMVARNTSINYVRDRRARARHEQAACSAAIAAAAQQVRTETPPYLRSEVKGKLAAIRDALPTEDRMLLVLRMDKRLAWKELARVMLGKEGGVTDAALARESQRLRKRFQLLKEQLINTGKREGILGDDERS